MSAPGEEGVVVDEGTGMMPMAGTTRDYTGGVVQMVRSWPVSPALSAHPSSPTPHTTHPKPKPKPNRRGTSRA